MSEQLEDRKELAKVTQLDYEIRWKSPKSQAQFNDMVSQLSDRYPEKLIKIRIERKYGVKYGDLPETSEATYQSKDETISDDLLNDSKLLELIDAELDKKIVREKEARRVVFLVANMRNVANLNKGSDNLIVNALSGTGKDHLVSAVFDLIPSTEKEELLRTTPKVLAYTRNRKYRGKEKMRVKEEDNTQKEEINRKRIESLTWKKTALRLEDVSTAVINDDAFKVIATADPNRINYSKTMIKQQVVEIEIEGKPSMILTIANPEIRDEQLRRFPMLFLNEGVDQTKEILIRQAERAKTGKSVEYDSTVLQAIAKLKRVSVRIPYADKLVCLFDESTASVIARTAFNRFLDYIKSSASLYQYQRETDSEGYTLAVGQDYENAILCLKKTTSNVLMIPLSKIDKKIYEFFAAHQKEQFSIDDLLEYSEIQQLDKSDRWIRFRADFLVSKGFLNRIAVKVEGSFKPVGKYSYNPVGELVLPSFDEVLKKTSNTTNESITSFTSINTNNSNTVSKGVSEVIEVKEVKSSINTNEEFTVEELD